MGDLIVSEEALAESGISPGQTALALECVRSGKKPVECYEAAGISRSTAYAAQSNPAFTEYLVTLQRRAFGVLGVRAASTMEKLLESSDERVQFRAAKDILDRAGHKPIERKQVALYGNVSISIDLG